MLNDTIRDDLHTPYFPELSPANVLSAHDFTIVVKYSGVAVCDGIWWCSERAPRGIFGLGCSVDYASPMRIHSPNSDAKV